MSDRMPLTEAVAIVRAARGSTDIVVSSMGSAREWLAMGPLHPLDFVYIPSAMGHAASLGLGLALAQPTRRVIVLMGDGSLLMNLGSLVTIAAERPQNLVVIVFDNGVYEVTGAQATPATVGVGVEQSRVDYVALARACGIASVQSFVTSNEWKSGIADAFDAS